VNIEPGGSWLLAGQLEAEIYADDGSVRRTRLQYPPGSPARPVSSAQLASKLADCTHGLDTTPAGWTWGNAAGLLRRYLPGRPLPAVLTT
jgi:hypothetical protein